jgi:hypothetical protein
VLTPFSSIAEKGKRNVWLSSLWANLLLECHDYRNDLHADGEVVPHRDNLHDCHVERSHVHIHYVHMHNRLGHNYRGFGCSQGEHAHHSALREVSADDHHAGSQDDRYAELPCVHNVHYGHADVLYAFHGS